MRKQRAGNRHAQFKRKKGGWNGGLKSACFQLALLGSAASAWAASAVDSYFEAFPDLQKEAKWEEITSLGLQALSNNPSDPNAAKIHGQLSSSYFYLGQFDMAQIHARLCYETGYRSGTEKEKIRGLYLLSAAARAKGEFEKAKTYARYALPMATGECRGKVLFNLGAAEAEDPQGDQEAAEGAYLQAMDLFECQMDRQRCSIRLGKLYLMRGDTKKTRSLLEKIRPEIENERIGMHADYLAAQLEKADGEKEKARLIAMKALEVALKLDAKKDADRIESFLESL